MPTHLRALVVIMGLSLAVLWLVRPLATEKAIAPEDFKRRAVAWIAITLLGFFAHNYWLYSLLTVPLMVIYGGRDSNRLCFFLFLLFAMPPFPAELPGFGVFNRLFAVDHLRWLALAVLMPAYWSLRVQPGVDPFGRTLADKFVIGYMGLWFVLQVPETTFTNLFRIILTLFTDIFLPYYVGSRALRTVKDHRDALMSFVVAVLIMAPIAVFETLRTWLLYSQLEMVLGLPNWGMGGYLERDGGILRAIAMAGHPIVLGFHMAVALSLCCFTYGSVANKRKWWAMFFVLMAGLIAAMSRGPWVGTAAMIVVMLATGPRAASKFMQAFMWALLLIPVLLSTDQGQKVIDYLPFIGTVETRNVEGRQHLFEVSLRVIADYPFFGALDFITHPEMEALRGNDGIVDLVNSYVSIALATGLVGLTLFVGPFLVAIFGTLRAVFTLDKQSEIHLLGRSLLGAIVAIMVTIGTVSSICAVPVVYFTVVGIAVGYVRMVATQPAGGFPGGLRVPPQRPAPNPRMGQPRRQP